MEGVSFYTISFEIIKAEFLCKQMFYKCLGILHVIGMAVKVVFLSRSGKNEEK